jgi:hypothetical protein
MLVDISKTHYLNKSCKFFQALLQCYASGPWSKSSTLLLLILRY